VTAILDDGDLEQLGTDESELRAGTTKMRSTRDGLDQASDHGSGPRSEPPRDALEGVATDPYLTVLLDDDELDGVFAPTAPPQQQEGPVFAQFFDEVDDVDDEPTRSRKRPSLPLPGQSPGQGRAGEQDETPPPGAAEEDPDITFLLSPEELISESEGEDDAGGQPTTAQAKKKGK